MLRKVIAYVFANRARTFLFLGILTVLLRLILSQMPFFTEVVFARGWFLGIRYLIDYTIGWSPVPFSYVLILALVGYWLWKIVARRRSQRPQAGKFKRALLNLGGFLGALVFFFHFLWGFNYERVPIQDHLGMQLDSMTVEQLCFEAEWAARQAEAARARIPGASQDSLGTEFLPDQLEQEVRNSVALCMDQFDYPFAGRVRGRVLVPGGWMLRLGISGIYNPFTGEGNVSGAQTAPKIPFTMAHEMAHGCGFGDEGTCNFVGMVACNLSKDPFVQYSGYMGYWTQLYNDLYAADLVLARMLASQLDPGIKSDQRASYNNYWRYHGRVAEIGQDVNNAYLNSQGVQGGIKSYDSVVLMRAAWRKKTGW